MDACLADGIQRAVHPISTSHRRRPSSFSVNLKIRKSGDLFHCRPCFSKAPMRPCLFRLSISLPLVVGIGSDWTAREKKSPPIFPAWPVERRYVRRSREQRLQQRSRGTAERPGQATKHKDRLAYLRMRMGMKRSDEYCVGL